MGSWEVYLVYIPVIVANYVDPHHPRKARNGLNAKVSSERAWMTPGMDEVSVRGDIDDKGAVSQCRRSWVTWRSRSASRSHSEFDLNPKDSS
jgi:hypothetical protein